MPIDASQFRTSLGRFATGITVVTASDADSEEMTGVTVNSFASVSLDPPLVLFSIAKTAASYEALMAAPAYCINVLSADQETVSNQFAQKGGDKFSGIAHSIDGNGAPRIDGCLTALSCRPFNLVEAGDHTVFISEVTEITLGEATDPLLYFSSAYRRLAP